MMQFDGKVLTTKFEGSTAKFNSQSTLFSKFNSLLVPVVNIGKVYTPFSKSKSHLQSSSKSISISMHFQSCNIQDLFYNHELESTNIARAVTTLSGH